MTEGALEHAMSRYAAGDDAAFATVYDLAASPILSFLTRLCRSRRELAEDLTHETFLRIHRARGLYRPGSAVLPWAYTIARRLFLDDVRNHRREVLHASTSDDGEATGESRLRSTEAAADELLVAHDLAELIEATLAEMPENQSTAFRLLKQDGLSLAEAAAVLGATTTAVKLRVHRAYEALRAVLQASGNIVGKEGDKP